MTAKDQLKVMRKGFTIIRADVHNLLIKYKDEKTLHWKTLENAFVSKAQLQRRMTWLLESSNIIED